jgi:hypothetical protein
MVAAIGLPAVRSRSAPELAVSAPTEVTYEPTPEVVVPISVTNHRGARIDVIGAEVSCRCAVIEGLPRTLESGETATINVRYSPGKAPESFLLQVRVLANSGIRTSTVAIMFSPVRTSAKGDPHETVE